MPKRAFGSSDPCRFCGTSSQRIEASSFTSPTSTPARECGTPRCRLSIPPLLLCGILTCRQHFHDRDIDELAHAIFDRVDWTWLSEDTALLSHGWTPELGFIPSRWDLYSELMMMYLLGLGSSAHPLRSEAWFAWKRTVFEYDGLRYIGSFAPLFVHQYSQAWFDFRGKRDRYADYFQNSVIATDVHRRFCLGLERTVLRLQQCALGHHCFRFRKRICGMGRTAGHGTDRWNHCARRGRRLAAISSASHNARPENHSRPLPECLVPLRFCGRVQPSDSTGMTQTSSVSTRASPC